MAIARPRSLGAHPFSTTDEAGVSEILGTILLTALTVTLVGGFGAVVLATLSDAGIAPTGDFLLEVEPGARTVDLVYASGSTFDLAEASIVVRVNDTQAPVTHTVVRSASADRFSPGDLLRLDLPADAPTPGAGTRVAAVVYHIETNQPIGGASTAVHGAASAAFSAGSVRLSDVTFSPASVVADGTQVTSVTATVESTFGQRYVRDVFVNLSAVGGPSAAHLRDTGEMGDAVAGDGTYTLQFAPSPAAVPLLVDRASAELTLTATDVSGRSASASSALLVLASPDRAGGTSSTGSGISVSNKVVGGAAFTRVPGSSQVASLYLTNFTFIDELEVNNDQIAVRISDLVDPTRTWTAWVHFTYCDSRPAVESITFLRDGVDGSAVYEPDACFPIALTSRVDLSFPPASRNMHGATQGWSVSGAPSLFNLENASIGGLNGAMIVHFGDKTPWTSSKTGLGQADLAWNYRPVASFTWSTSGAALSVDARASYDLEGPIASYRWDWGDGTSGTGATALKTYATSGNRTVTLTVTDGYGATAALVQDVALVDDRPTATLTARVESGDAPLSTVFELAADGTDRNVTSWTLAFGDGTTQSGATLPATVAKTYTTLGRHDATFTVTDNAGGQALANATIRVHGFTYASTATSDETGGTITHVENLARDGGGDVATFSEASGLLARVLPADAVDRAFSSPPTGWSVATSGFVLEHDATQGDPAGAMAIRKTNGGAATLGTAGYAWTKSAAALPTAGGTLSLSYRFDAATNATRWIEAHLVKPDGSTVGLGARPWSSSWTDVAFSVDAAHLEAAGTYKLALAGKLDGNNDRVLFDNVQLSWNETAQVFGRDVALAPPLDAGAVHALEIRYRTAANAEGLRVHTLDAGALVPRETLSSPSFTTYTRTLSASETSGGVALRLLDSAEAGDALASSWEIDYIRIYTVFP